MATATESVIKPEHEAARKHFIFTQEHLDLRESMKAWVQKELHPTGTSGRRPTGPPRS